MLSKDKHLPLGLGISPIKQFLSILKQTECDGIITIEISGTLK